MKSYIPQHSEKPGDSQKPENSFSSGDRDGGGTMANFYFPSGDGQTEINRHLHADGLPVSWEVVTQLGRAFLEGRVNSTGERARVARIFSNCTPEQQCLLIMVMRQSGLSDGEIQYYTLVPQEPDL